jgi:putative membrane protein insertion efficiency factor
VNAARRAFRAAGAPARALLIGLIGLYRLTLSGWLGGQCRFEPSCSGYALEAIRARGALAGSAFAMWRILRCQPYGRGGWDPAPAKYDAHIRTGPSSAVEVP